MFTCSVKSWLAHHGEFTVSIISDKQVRLSFSRKGLVFFSYQLPRFLLFQHVQLRDWWFVRTRTCGDLCSTSHFVSLFRASKGLRAQNSSGEKPLHPQPRHSKRGFNMAGMYIYQVSAMARQSAVWCSVLEIMPYRKPPPSGRLDHAYM